MQWTKIQKITCLLSSCTSSHFSANYLPFCGVGAISSIIAVALLYPWQSRGALEAKLAQCMCLGYVPWDQPPDRFQEWVSMPEFILFCLQTSELSDLAKKKKSTAFSSGLHIKIVSVVFVDSSTVVFPASNAFLFLLLIQMERFSKQKPSILKACVSLCVSLFPATSVCRYLSFCCWQICPWRA